MQKTINNIIIVFLFSLIFLPDFKVFGLYVRYDDIILVLLFLLIVVQHIIFHRKIHFVFYNSFIFIILLFAISVLWYMFNQKYDNSSYFYLIKTSLMFIKYYLVIFVLVNSNIKKLNINKIVIILGTVIAIIGIMQRFNLLNINTFIMSYYRSGLNQYGNISYLMREMGRARIMATFYNPNAYAQFLVIFIVSLFLEYYREHISNRFFFFALFLFLVNLLFTASRTNIIVISLWFCVINFYMYMNKKENKKVFLWVMLIIIIFISINELYQFLDYSRFYIINYSNSRYNVVDGFQMIIKESPIFGKSLLHEEYGGAFDSEYLMVYFFTGIWGLLFYLFYILKHITFKLNIDNQQMFKNSIMIVILVWGFATTFFFRVRFFELFLVFYYYNFHIRNTNRKR